MERILEPEVMDSEKEAFEYDQMDHSEVNRIFVDDFLDFSSPDDSSTVLDVGTGTALIPMELCQRDSKWNVTGIDLAHEMIQRGKTNVANANLNSQIEVICCDAKSSPFSENQFSTIISNSIIHHIPNPDSILKEMLRLLKSGGLLFIRDLLRPGTHLEVENLVAFHTGDANEYQKQLFRQSLHAALTVEEVRSLLGKNGLPTDAVTQTSDRHWTISLYVP